MAPKLLQEADAFSGEDQSAHLQRGCKHGAAAATLAVLAAALLAGAAVLAAARGSSGTPATVPGLLDSRVLQELAQRQKARLLLRTNSSNVVRGDSRLDSAASSKPKGDGEEPAVNSSEQALNLLHRKLDFQHYKHLEESMNWNNRELRLTGCNIGVGGAKALAWLLQDEALPAMRSVLEVMDLSSNGIGNAGVKSIAQALPALKKLYVLNLATNQIGDEGAWSLAQALPALPEVCVGSDQWKGLTRLSLGDNAIGDEGARLIAQALPEMKALKLLDLTQNQIGDEGAKSVAQALPAATALDILDLTLNRISNESAQAIAQAWSTAGKSNSKLSLEP